MYLGQQQVPNMYGTKAMNVVKFVIQQTGTYNQQYRRPFQTDLDQHGLNRIMEAVDQQTKLTPSTLANVAAGFIHPSAAPEAAIGIVNGWNEARFRFMLEVSSVDRTGMMATKEFVSGYTDHPGMSFGGALDPDMLFFVNSVQSVRERVSMTPLGNQTHHNVIDSSHVLVNNQYGGITSMNHMYGLRPEDVFDQMDNRVLSQNLDHADNLVMDGRTKITGSAQKSSRSNAVAPVYMANVMDSYLQMARNQPDENQSGILNAARGAVESGAVMADPFMSFVKACSPMSGGNSFKLKDLIALDPNTMNVTHVMPLTPQNSAGIHRSGLTADWSGADYATLFATTISQSVPSYMSAYRVQKLHLRSTNNDMGGKMNTAVVNVRSLTQGVDLARDMQALIFRLENELLRGLSQNSLIGYELDLRCDLFGETWITISINGAAPVEFVTPSFSDALLAPVVTQDFMKLDTAAADFDVLTTKIFENDKTANAGKGLATGLI